MRASETQQTIFHIKVYVSLSGSIYHGDLGALHLLSSKFCQTSYCPVWLCSSIRFSKISFQYPRGLKSSDPQGMNTDLEGQGI